VELVLHLTQEIKIKNYEEGAYEIIKLAATLADLPMDVN
jgi:hypothetical protein